MLRKHIAQQWLPCQTGDPDKPLLCPTVKPPEALSCPLPRTPFCAAGCLTAWLTPGPRARLAAASGSTHVLPNQGGAGCTHSRALSAPNSRNGALHTHRKALALGNRDSLFLFFTHLRPLQQDRKKKIHPPRTRLLHQESTRVQWTWEEHHHLRNVFFNRWEYMVYIGDAALLLVLAQSLTAHNKQVLRPGCERKPGSEECSARSEAPQLWAGCSMWAALQGTPNRKGGSNGTILFTLLTQIRHTFRRDWNSWIFYGKLLVSCIYQNQQESRNNKFLLKAWGPFFIMVSQ